MMKTFLILAFLATSDFCAEWREAFCIEATIALPAQGEAPAHSFDRDRRLGGLNEFNSQAAVRISNSFTGKAKKLRARYARLEHCVDKPFVISIASFDRLYSHFAASRPALAALYGLYHDEEATPAARSEQIVSYNVYAAYKNGVTEIPMGLFCTPEDSDVSALIYSSLATWGKLRAFARNTAAPIVFQTFTPDFDSLYPRVHTAVKSDYSGHLLDGLYVLHNPFAEHPLPRTALGHPRIAQCFVQDDFEAPDDFLLFRYLILLKYAR